MRLPFHWHAIHLRGKTDFFCTLSVAIFRGGEGCLVFVKLFFFFYQCLSQYYHLVWLRLQGQEILCVLIHSFKRFSKVQNNRSLLPPTWCFFLSLNCPWSQLQSTICHVHLLFGVFNSCALWDTVTRHVRWLPPTPAEGSGIKSPWESMLEMSGRVRECVCERV